ncbi:MAG TPA: recombinase family protein [Roseiflexaceae bacterium]|nr:recombinase family protein [Roseiflexaceae bacterium]
MSHKKASVTATPAAPAEETRRAGLYLRVSTEEQATGYGLDVQKGRCEAMCAVKGWTVADVYTDAGISGTKPAAERPALASLLADVESGKVNAVVVLALDRLGRKTALVLELVETISAAGAELVSCKEQLDTSTPAGRFVLTLFAGLAALERDTIVERTTAGRNERGRKDGERGGKLPYGYTRTADGPMIDAEAAAVVRRIFGMRAADSKISLRDIAYNLQGLCDGPRGGRWSAETVRIILGNESAYRGGPRGDSAVCWPTILD